MARSGKDHFENAIRGFERDLRQNKVEKIDKETEDFRNWMKDLREYITFDRSHSLTAFNRISNEKVNKQKLHEFYKSGTSFSLVSAWVKQTDEDTPKMTGILDRELWLKNKAIIEAKEKGLYVKPGKEPVSPKEVSIISAQYGLEEERLIDVTDKILVGQKFTNKLAGEDPCPNKKKQVIIKAIVDGVEGEYVFIENKKIIF
jgi:uncharacterized membrane protein YkvA (DUF1232 family)